MSEVALRDDLSPEQRVVEAVRQPAMRAELEAALPTNVNVERFVRVTVTALRENPDILKADHKTLLAAVIRCAQDGLLPDGHEAALVRFGNTAVYLPMIGGFRKIAAEQDWAIQTRVVYEHDEFDYELGLTPNIVHRPARLLSDRGDPIAAYAVGFGPNGKRELEVMDRDEVEQVRAVSRSKDSGPWVTWWTRMAEKTVGRRLFKKLPLGDRERIERVLEAEERLPADAAAELYGPKARAALSEAPSAGADPAAREGEDETPQETPRTPDAASPTASGAEEGEDGPPEPSSAADPEPEFEGAEPEPEAAVEAEVVGDPIVAEAGEQKFTSGRHKGRTLREIHKEHGDGQYIVWASRSWQEGKLKSACITYAAAEGLA